MDIYQQRYLDHQKRKKELLENKTGSDIFWSYGKGEKSVFELILKNRRSQRIFNNKQINSYDIKKLLELAEYRPSSCNRKAVKIKIISDKRRRNTLSHLLVGGRGWIQNGQKILLFLSADKAYKSPVEKSYMPYLDTGVLAQTIYLICEVMNIGTCFVNPNIREEDKKEFNKFFGEEGFTFCGAMPIGNYDKKAIK